MSLLSVRLCELDLTTLTGTGAVACDQEYTLMITMCLMVTWHVPPSIEQEGRWWDTH